MVGPAGGQPPSTRVVYGLITRWGHVGDDSAPFAMTAAVVRDCAPSRCTDTRGYGCMVGDELPLLRKWWRESGKCEVEFTHDSESHSCIPI